MSGSFEKVASFEQNPNYEKLVAREEPLYDRPGDVRNAFERDYTRVLHSQAYRRLKHKTQVFYNVDNDHVCTRIEHVSHVESVSGSIAEKLGLNADLTRAIATSHDLGHAPFGHQGETILDTLSKKYLGKSFWHEQNGLRFVDHIELLKDDCDLSRNLNLTYAVRDGIISHCGEVDENGLRPRDEFIDLSSFEKPGQFAPVTWEGCVVKISDKIAYVGRDIEDALELDLLTKAEEAELRELAELSGDTVLNTTIIMNHLIRDICEFSSPEQGITLSDKSLKQLNDIKKFNYKHIYYNERMQAFIHYSELVLTELFDTLYRLYENENVFECIESKAPFYPQLIKEFSEFLAKYCDPSILPFAALKETAKSCCNHKVYGKLDSESLYVQAVLDFIAGMTDSFALRMYNELLSF